MHTEDTHLNERLWKHAEAYRTIGNHALAELLEEAAGEIEIAIGLIDEPDQTQGQRFVERHSTPFSTSTIDVHIGEIAAGLSQNQAGFSVDEVAKELQGVHRFPPSKMSIARHLHDLGYRSAMGKLDGAIKRVWLKPLEQQEA